MPIKYRILTNILILSLIFIVPWWLSLILVGISIFVFRNFYESFVFAILLDGYHSIPSPKLFGTGTFFILCIAIIFIISIFLKTRLKFY